MKLQNLVIIFLAIALPIIILLSVYVELQVDTASLKARYDNYLINAAHETVVAFQMNTINDEFLTVSDAKIRDLEAALNVFSSSLSTSFGATGSNKSHTMSYVPALIFTLYDGYYIYTPTKSWNTGTFSHELKAYVHYSKEYMNATKSKVLTINYSLDNYIAVYYYNGQSYESRAGYLEIEPNDKNAFLETLNEESRKYYIDAWSFTDWFNKQVIDDFNTEETKGLKITRSNGNNALPGENSSFNDEKYNVIKDSITNNLIQAMYVYGKNTNYDFEMPKLTGDDWNTILNNVCFIAFLQGVPVGTTIYNDYTIAVSTENKEFINENSLYYVNTDSNGNIVGSYHRPWCPELLGSSNIMGYNNIEFKNQKSSKYSNIPACYYCTVRASNSTIKYAENYYVNNNYPVGYNINNRCRAYYNTLASEKLKLSKLSNFISESGKLTR